MTACPGSLCEADLVPKPGVVDNAVYVDGYRVDSPPTLEQTYDLQKRREGPGLDRSLPAQRRHDPVGGPRVRPAPPDGGGRDRRAPASQAGAVRHHAVHRPPSGSLPRRGGGGRVRRAARDHRPRLRGHHPARRASGPGSGPAAAGEVPRPCCARAPKPSSTASSTRSSTTTLRWSPAWRTTSTRSRSSCSTAIPTVSQRIYLLMGEVMDFQRAVKPLVSMMENLARGFEKYRVDIELQRNLRDVQDHVLRIVEQIDGFRTLLQNALSVDATLTAQRQNEETKRLTETSLEQGEQMKRVSSWAAILFAPSLIGGIYGMNFDHMPETHWRFGLPDGAGHDAGPGADPVHGLPPQGLAVDAGTVSPRRPPRPPRPSTPARAPRRRCSWRRQRRLGPPRSAPALCARRCCADRTCTTGPPARPPSRRRSPSRCSRWSTSISGR